MDVNINFHDEKPINEEDEVFRISDWIYYLVIAEIIIGVLAVGISLSLILIWNVIFWF